MDNTGKNFGGVRSGKLRAARGLDGHKICVGVRQLAKIRFRCVLSITVSAYISVTFFTKIATLVLTIEYPENGGLRVHT